jgi:hypothetical protein
MPTGTEIMTRAGVLLNDGDHSRWPLAELAEWINEGMRAIVLTKPSAFSHTVVVHLGVGTRQAVPATGTPVPLILIGLNRNIIYTPGVAPSVGIVDVPEPREGGRMIRRADRKLLDSQSPNWHSTRSVKFTREVRNYTFDELVPLEFYTYPGNDGTGYVEAELGFSPPPLVATGDPLLIASYGTALALPEPYSVPLLDYTLYRCEMKDDLGAAAGRSAMHYQQFATAIGLKIQVEKSHSPNARP